MRRLFVFLVLSAFVGLTALPAQASAGLVRNIYRGSPSSDPHDFTLFKGKVYFVANDGVHGQEIWKTNGTAKRTRLVKDLRVGTTGSDPLSLTVVNGRLVFWALDATDTYRLWTTDGTAGGTHKVSNAEQLTLPAFSELDARPVLVPIGTYAFFAADGSNGTELYQTDGAALTASFNINPTGDSDPALITPYGSDAIFFRADDGTNGIELFKYEDGNPELIDVNTSSAGASSTPRSLAIAGSTLFFSAVDGSHGRELWAYDIPTEVKSLIDINQTNPSAASNPAEITNMGGIAYLVASGDLNSRLIGGAATGPEVWRSDGTSIGTKVVSYVGGGTSGGSAPYGLTVAGSLLYFGATNSTGDNELFRTTGVTSDVDASATQKLDVNPDGSSEPFALTATGNKLFFTATGSTVGAEPFRTDGTTVTLVKDIRNPGDSTPTEFVLYGTKVLFDADDGIRGRELWRTAF
jgi:ELWxxDGT repeat protein